MSRVLAVCLFWAAFLLAANLDDERRLLSSLELAAAKAIDVARPYAIGIITLVPVQFANADPTPPVPETETSAAGPSVSTGSWTASVAPTSQQTFAASPMSPMPVTPTPTNTPLTTIAVIPSRQPIPQARKTSGWGSAAFGLGLQSGAPSQSWHSSRTPDNEQWSLKDHP
jgi:hypothetical protein